MLDRVIDDHLATLMLTLGLYLMMSSGILVVFGPQSPAFAFPLTGVIHGHGLLCADRESRGAGRLHHRDPVDLRPDLSHRFRPRACVRSPMTARLRRRRDCVPQFCSRLAFALATGLAGLTGVLVTPILSLAPHIGDPVLATSFLIVILGGLGSVGGATVAAFLVGMVGGLFGGLSRRLEGRARTLRARPDHAGRQAIGPVRSLGAGSLST